MHHGIMFSNYNENDKKIKMIIIFHTNRWVNCQKIEIQPENSVIFPGIFVYDEIKLYYLVYTFFQIDI